MDFCECGALLVPDKQTDGTVVMKCNSCGKMIGADSSSNSKAFEIKQTIRHSDLEKTVIIDNESEVETMPTVTASCEKCGHHEAVYWQLQTRRSNSKSWTTGITRI